MTTVNLKVLETILGGFGPVPKGYVSAYYWAGVTPYTAVSGDEVRLPTEIRVDASEGDLALDMVPTGGVCCVKWYVRNHTTGAALSRYTEIPDVASIDFGDLVDVDPRTFQPSDAGQAAWDAAIAEMRLLLETTPTVVGAEVAEQVPPVVAAVVTERVDPLVTEMEAAVAAAVSAKDAAEAVPVTNDGIMAPLVARDETATAKEVDARIQGQVAPLVAEAIADVPAVVDAAAASAAAYAASAGKREAIGVINTVTDTVPVTNVVTNPRGAVNRTNWEVSGGNMTTLPTGADDGHAAVEATVTTVASFVFGYTNIPVTPGWWVFGVRTQLASAAPSATMTFQLRFYDASGTQLAATNRTVSMVNGVADTTQFSAVVPAGAVRARYILFPPANPTLSVGDKVRAWLFTAHQGRDYLGVFDATRAGASWTGSPNASATVLLTPAPREFDVVVVGGSEGGALAAVASARLGSTVALVCEDDRVGGVTGWALTVPDFISAFPPGMVRWGLTQELFDRVAAKGEMAYPGAPRTTSDRWYRLGGGARPSWWVQVFEEMLLEAGVVVIRNAPLRRVIRTGTVIERIQVGSHSIIVGKDFVDGTPTGDLIRLAGVTTSIGREAQTQYSETGAGITTPVTQNIDPYVIPGDPTSGLIYGVTAGTGGTVGAADPNHIMLSGIRTYISRSANRRAPWPEPSVYDPTKYEMMARYWASNPSVYNATSAVTALAATFTLYALDDTNLEFDLNHKLYPTALPEPALWREYVDATHERRQQITALARDYLLGLVKFIRTSNDPRVPANLKAALNTYGPTVDELSSHGGIAPIPYVREGRRMVGTYTLTKVNATTAQAGSNAQQYISWMAYNYDAKVVRTFVQSGVVHGEGAHEEQNNGQVFGAPVPYGVLTPKATEITNLLSPGAPSVSRHAWLAIRATPVIMNLGESAGVAAAIAAKRGIPVQAVQASEIRANTGQISPGRNALIVGTGYEASGTLDTGAWTQVAAADARWPGPSAMTFWEAPAGEATPFRYKPYLAAPGMYRIQVFYAPGNTDERGAQPVTRPTDTTVKIVHADGTTTRTLNQQYPVGAGGRWEDLGNFYFGYGNPSPHYVEFDASTVTAGKAIAGLVSFTKLT